MESWLTSGDPLALSLAYGWDDPDLPRACASSWMADSYGMSNQRLPQPPDSCEHHSVTGDIDSLSIVLVHRSSTDQLTRGFYRRNVPCAVKLLCRSVETTSASMSERRRRRRRRRWSASPTRRHLASDGLNLAPRSPRSAGAATVVRTASPIKTFWPQLGSIGCKHNGRWQYLSRMKIVFKNKKL